MSLTIKKTGPAQGATDCEVWYVPLNSGAGEVYFVAVGAASAAVASNALSAGKLYVFSSSTDCWIKQGTGAQTAAKSAGSMFVAKGIQVMIDGAQGNTLAVLQDAAGGNCSLTQIDA